MKKIIFSVIISIFCYHLYSQDLQEITGFGTNQGNLKMYVHVPTNLQTSAPIVVALHGCTQSAIDCSNTTGWNELSDKYGFIVLYPEQQYANNSSYCFNWFLPSDQERDVGEALSIKQMADYVQENFNVDADKIFITGLSAGAGMSTVMLACYPDIFNAGAIMSGVPYKAASDALTASNAMYGLINKTPQEWASLVTNAYPQFTGNYPRVCVFHGLQDMVVYPANINELTEQWTAVHNISQTASGITTSFNSNPDIEQSVYKNQASDTIVLVYKINNMGHAIAVDPGFGSTQGGTTGTYAIDKNFHSSYWAAKFFGLINLLSSEREIVLSEHASKLKVYQNFSKNEISVFSSSKEKQNVSVCIFNSLGEKIFEKINPEEKISFNTCFISPGIYVCALFERNVLISTARFSVVK
ncbi:MAG: hypothetical protein A2309_07430 [Bacteroidetes bacterium RIFOXYB2_FULL_35_7]|nr:MAG: hypothetical protein A2309_07430 [Bacteroidetes bacterium RIFOXYB2_FULL_35_7]